MSSAAETTLPVPAPRDLLPAGPETVVGWGRLGVRGRELAGEDLERLTENQSLSRGLGRSYGDAALPGRGVEQVVSTRLADRILSFDVDTGHLRAEAGFTIEGILEHMLPQGWFTPVTPGTRFVTLGGAVASDVHGKRHHVNGTIGQHITDLKLRLASGEVVLATPDNVHSDLFWATTGGMGLTGHILEVGLQLERAESPWIWQHSSRVPNIEAFMEALTESAAEWPMTVGWIDCLSRGRNMGRGILTRGRWATPDEAPKQPPGGGLPLAVPVEFPGFVLNDYSAWAFNQLYYWKHLPQHSRKFVSPEPFFYPLDAIHHWNRIYGQRGFTQHQAVLPRDAGTEAVVRYVELLTQLGGASFLCVIKDCGPEAPGLLSFPLEGTSIALDLPIVPGIQELVNKLNRFVIDHGGRIYLAKDTFTTASDYRAMDPRVDRFLDVRRKYDPEGQIRSALSERLFGW